MKKKLFENFSFIQKIRKSDRILHDMDPDSCFSIANQQDRDPDSHQS